MLANFASILKLKTSLHVFCGGKKRVRKTAKHPFYVSAESEIESQKGISSISFFFLMIGGGK